MDYTDYTDICQVCGFRVLESPRRLSEWDFVVICPCCGMHYGCDDFMYMMPRALEKYHCRHLNRLSPEKYHDLRMEAWDIYRNRWIKDGALFWHKSKEPEDWDVQAQLETIGIYIYF